jgi:hypothetical protein
MTENDRRTILGGYNSPFSLVLRHMKPPLTPKPYDVVHYKYMLEEGQTLSYLGDEREVTLEKTTLDKHDPFQNFVSGRLMKL